MTTARKAFDKIMDGLTDALAYAHGDTRRGKARTVARGLSLRGIDRLRDRLPVIDVRAARNMLGQ